MTSDRTDRILSALETSGQLPRTTREIPSHLLDWRAVDALRGRLSRCEISWSSLSPGEQAAVSSAFPPGPIHAPG